MPSKTSSSSIPGFRTLPIQERRARIAEATGIPLAALEEALAGSELDLATAEAMVENAIGALALPFGVALNVRVNATDYLVPMAIEEPSVIAATSHAAKRVRAGGGFVAEADEPLMTTQIEVHGVRDPEAAAARIGAAAADLLRDANEAVPGLVARGGGARRLSARDLGEGYVVTHVEVDCRDAMGANLLNTIAEALGPRVAALAGGELGLRILSNYCEKRRVRVRARVPVEALGDERTPGIAAARGIASASRFAERDPYRAVTHNKGIMNGVDAVVAATGNDWRAVEAAAHAFAARSGSYGPLATWRLTEDEAALEGKLELPLALGTVGGALRAHRGAMIALEIAGVSSASELAMVTAATGLATNLAALRALSTEGIQRGHMALHHRATAASAGASPLGTK
jgi:hydroxymethylglutaryl-CoA reductase